MFRRRTSDSPEEAKTEEQAGIEIPPQGEEAISLESFPRKRTHDRPVQFHPDVPRRAPVEKAQSMPQTISQTVSQTVPQSGPQSAPRTDPESRRLLVGKDISLTGGEIADCDRLIVEGHIDGTAVDARILEIMPGGSFNGSAVVESADIGGSFEGEIKVRTRLTIQASGQVQGRVRYGQLEIERGGRLIGEAEYDEAGREAELQPVKVEKAAQGGGAAMREAMASGGGSGGSGGVTPIETD